LGVDPGETVQVRQVRRRDGDGIPRLTGEGRLASQDGIGVERVGRRRRETRLPKGGPELRGLDDRVGRQGQEYEAAAGIESVVQAPEAADGTDPEQFATDFVMGDFRDDDGCAGCRNGIEPRNTPNHLRLARSADNQPKRSAVQQDQPCHD
jgi:hypothetical protein